VHNMSSCTWETGKKLPSCKQAIRRKRGKGDCEALLPSSGLAKQIRSPLFLGGRFSEQKVGNELLPNTFTSWKLGQKFLVET